ncbi:hypothetical protein QBZ16_001216 [Prototheca wickerhamii]|uniref:Gamma-interferon-inducible lysosomal thiol reductase n=1 Tax=Prototheca wickerhamii TaxID=3111 RepID=A0AAD9IFQ4_PROWI|nr:hypothetical protein QBZ16_001216 [Prototheca wickerhamii]
MATNNKVWTVIGGVVLVCLLLAVLPKAPAPGRLGAGAPAPIVEFYGESLCPDCKHMVEDILAPMFESGVADLMTLKYVAYGKVKDGQCQHGPRECLFNRYINCAQELHPQQRDWFPYVQCLAGDLAHIEDKAPGCASARGWRHADLEACAMGSKGQALELVAEQATQRLEPKLTNVPWVLINGVPLGKDFENLDRYVCASSGATGRPDVCNDLTARTRYQ